MFRPIPKRRALQNGTQTTVPNKSTSDVQDHDISETSDSCTLSSSHSYSDPNTSISSAMEGDGTFIMHEELETKQLGDRGETSEEVKSKKQPKQESITDKVSR